MRVTDAARRKAQDRATMKSDFLLLPLLLRAWLALSVRAHGVTTLTITVTDLPDSGGTANGQAVAFAGTLNGWDNSATIATVSNGRLVFSFPNIGSLPALGSSWGDAPANANVAFQFLSPGTWNPVICTDFISNEANFRLALAENADNVVEIDAGPVPWLVDQPSAVRVNGVVERNSPAIDLTRFAFPGGKWKALNGFDSVDDSYLVRWDRVARPGLIHWGAAADWAEFGFFKMAVPE